MTEEQEKKKCSVCKKKRHCNTIGLSYCCGSSECFDALIKKAKLRGQRRLAALKKKQEKNELKKQAIRKEADTSLEKLCVRTQKVVNTYLRAVDTYEGHSCISCRGPVEHAGHLYHSGSKWKISRFRFSHIIIHGQCIQVQQLRRGR